MDPIGASRQDKDSCFADLQGSPKGNTSAKVKGALDAATRSRAHGNGVEGHVFRKLVGGHK